eukprot:jgi/Botrbrau1/12185/Bobra.0186s0092.1
MWPAARESHTYSAGKQVPAVAERSSSAMSRCCGPWQCKWRDTSFPQFHRLTFATCVPDPPFFAGFGERDCTAPAFFLARCTGFFFPSSPLLSSTSTLPDTESADASRRLVRLFQPLYVCH